MPDEKKMDLDEPVNVDMDPADALRILLGEELREESPHDDAEPDPDSDE